MPCAEYTIPATPLPVPLDNEPGHAILPPVVHTHPWKKFVVAMAFVLSPELGGVCTVGVPGRIALAGMLIVHVPVAPEHPSPLTVISFAVPAIVTVPPPPAPVLASVEL